jgi:hypothetical protein
MRVCSFWIKSLGAVNAALVQVVAIKVLTELSSFRDSAGGVCLGTQLAISRIRFLAAIWLRAPGFCWLSHGGPRCSSGPLLHQVHKDSLQLHSAKRKSYVA